MHFIGCNKRIKIIFELQNSKVENIGKSPFLIALETHNGRSVKEITKYGLKQGCGKEKQRLGPTILEGKIWKRKTKTRGKTPSMLIPKR